MSDNYEKANDLARFADPRSAAEVSTPRSYINGFFANIVLGQ